MRGSFAERSVDRAALLIMFASTAVTVSLLLVDPGLRGLRRLSYLNWGFITSLPTPVGEGGGGIANALVGSLEVVAVASAMAIPIGVGAAIFLNEFHSGWLGWFVRFLADTLIGVPSIVVGLVAYAMVVQPMRAVFCVLGLRGLCVHHDPDHPHYRPGSPSARSRYDPGGIAGLGNPDLEDDPADRFAHLLARLADRLAAGFRARARRGRAHAVHGVRQSFLEREPLPSRSRPCRWSSTVMRPPPMTIGTLRPGRPPSYWCWSFSWPAR